MRLSILFLFLCGLNCSGAPPSSSFDTFPITSTTSDKLSNLLFLNQGKVVVLHFWVSYYQGAAQDLLLLKELKQQFPSENLFLLAVSLDPNGLSVVQPFVEKHQIDYQILIGYQPVIERYQIRNLPKTCLYNPAGQLVEEIFGPLGLSTLSQKVKTLSPP